ncbi:MAG: DNA-formamidopyrimidine glycosylase family protein, partial [Microbacterium sp.]
MPEMPEVQGLADFLDRRVTGLRLTRAQPAAVSALRTVDPPIEALVGARARGVARHGKFLDVATTTDADEPLHLVFHLAKAGWLRWCDTAPTAAAKPGRGPTALRVAFDDGSGFDLTEAGTRKALAVYVVRAPADVPGIARLGPDPLDPAFTRDTLAGLLAGRRTHVKGTLRDQSVIAGVGNAYSDEILHGARMSPYATAASLDDGEIDTLFAAIRDTLADAVAT